MPLPPKNSDPEILVPDPTIWKEFGVCSMTLFRWSRDQALGFPPAVKINGRNFRSRRALEEFKAKLLAKTIAERGAKKNNAKAVARSVADHTTG